MRVGRMGILPVQAERLHDEISRFMQNRYICDDLVDPWCNNWILRNQTSCLLETFVTSQVLCHQFWGLRFHSEILPSIVMDNTLESGGIQPLTMSPPPYLLDQPRDVAGCQESVRYWLDNTVELTAHFWHDKTAGNDSRRGREELAAPQIPWSSHLRLGKLRWLESL